MGTTGATPPALPTQDLVAAPLPTLLPPTPVRADTGEAKTVASHDTAEPTAAATPDPDPSGTPVADQLPITDQPVPLPILPTPELAVVPTQAAPALAQAKAPNDALTAPTTVGFNQPATPYSASTAVPSPTLAAAANDDAPAAEPASDGQLSAPEPTLASDSALASAPTRTARLATAPNSFATDLAGTADTASRPPATPAQTRPAIAATPTSAAPQLAPTQSASPQSASPPSTSAAISPAPAPTDRPSPDDGPAAPSRSNASASIRPSNAAVTMASPAKAQPETVPDPTPEAAAPAPTTTSTAALATAAPPDRAPVAQLAPPPPAAQVAQALAEPVRVVLSKPAEASDPHVTTIQIAPAELGRVEIRIERATDGLAKIQLVAERHDTLTKLIGDQSMLHHALDGAGLAASHRTIEFSLAPPAPPAPGSASFAGGQSSHQQQPGTGSQGSQAYASRAFSFSDDPATAATLPTRSLRTGLDITA